MLFVQVLVLILILVLMLVLVTGTHLGPHVEIGVKSSYLAPWVKYSHLGTFA